MFISDAFASSGNAVQDIMSTGIQLGLIFMIFYLLLIRPQQKKMKQHNEMLMAIKAGDKVITGGGIYAKVIKTDGAHMTVEVADGVQIMVNRLTIRDIVDEEPKKSKTVTKSDEKKTKQAKNNKK